MSDTRKLKEAAAISARECFSKSIHVEKALYDFATSKDVEEFYQKKINRSTSSFEPVPKKIQCISKSDDDDWTPGDHFTLKDNGNAYWNEEYGGFTVDYYKEIKHRFKSLDEEKALFDPNQRINELEAQLKEVLSANEILNDICLIKQESVKELENEVLRLKEIEWMYNELCK